MTINYPRGLSSSNHGTNNTKKQARTLNYNNKFANRGMTFEEDINQSNEFYRNRKIALVYKKPTPIQVVKVDYPRRSAAVIREAYYKHASTTDYNGVYNGYYIDFEAKETKNKTSFPLSNFHEHQIEHMKECRDQQGIAFVLLWFSTLKRCFFLDSKILQTFWENKLDGKKSIPLSEIEAQGTEIPLGVMPRVPYIEALNEYIKEGDSR